MKEDDSKDRFCRHIDPEIEEIFTRIQEMQNDLEAKIAYIQSQAKSFSEDFLKVLENPDLIKNPRIDELKNQQSKLEKDVADVVGYSPTKKVSEKEKKRAQKRGRKSQTLKGKKKGWLSMD